ncbi:hypothetical protein [Halorubrum sp. DTA46]|uniref:hypothetical protein n=1 Tax=Halorubrum sp. DTA46 TaxID=3402162 RepID=UPI003AAE665B
MGLERRDGRNMLVIAAIVAVLVVVIAEGALGVRVVAGAIAGSISAVVFVVSTLLINRFKPDHW